MNFDKAFKEIEKRHYALNPHKDEGNPRNLNHEALPYPNAGSTADPDFKRI